MKKYIIMVLILVSVSIVYSAETEVYHVDWDDGLANGYVKYTSTSSNAKFDEYQFQGADSVSGWICYNNQSFAIDPSSNDYHIVMRTNMSTSNDAHKRYLQVGFSSVNSGGAQDCTDDNAGNIIPYIHIGANSDNVYFYNETPINVLGTCTQSFPDNVNFENMTLEVWLFQNDSVRVMHSNNDNTVICDAEEAFDMGTYAQYIVPHAYEDMFAHPNYASGFDSITVYTIDAEGGGSGVPTLTVNSDLKNTININDNYIEVRYNGTYGNTSGDLFDCTLFNGTVHQPLITQLQVNLSDNQLFNVTYGEVEYNYSLFIHCSQENVLPIETIETLYGTRDSGDITSVQTYNDGNNYSVSESAGAYPVMQIEINFTNVTTMNEIIINYWYDGGVAHNVDLELYNYTGADWFHLGDLVVNTELTLNEFDFVNNDDFINGTNAKVRIDHKSNGINSHDMYIDFIQLGSQTVNDSTSIFNYAVDTILPQVVITSTFTNHSQHNQGDTLEITTQYVDANLFAYNLTVFDVNGIVYNSLNWFAENITVSNITNVSSWSLTDNGNYSIRAEIWDSHTGEKVKPKTWYYEDSVLKVEDLEITGDIKYEPDKTYFYLSEDASKYKFKVTFEDSKKDHSLFISSDSNLIPIIGSEYACHFVWDYTYWFDCESQAIQSVSIQEINGGYNLSFTFYEGTDEVEFESIGDLNYASYQWYYTVVSADTAYLQSIDTTLTNIYEVINLIPIVMLYAILLGFGYWLTQTYNFWIGLPFLMASIGFNFYFWRYWESTIPEIGVAFAGLTLGTVIMWFFLNRKVYKQRRQAGFF